MTKKFSNRTAIISGGLGDIGRAVALELAGQGANIALGDVLPVSEAAGFILQLQDQGVSVHYSQTDVSDPDDVAKWISIASEAIGTPSLVIVNAATVTQGTFQALSAAQWTREININLNGAFYLAQTATTAMLQSGLTGSVVFIGSWAAHAVHPAIPAYSVSKAGIRMLCQCMALELAPRGILVNEIAPGYVNAGLSAKIWEENPGLSEEARLKVPVRKLIDATEVASQVAYLCDPQNKHITGSVLLMDGGLSLLR